MNQSNPIALFVYKRPDHTRRTLEALLANHGFGNRPLYIFSDGPKTSKDIIAVESVR
ncbi:MAG: glycosyltransferase family 2 protein, partial [Proteobacteria bacterium]